MPTWSTIFSAETNIQSIHVNLTLFENLSCNTFLKRESVYINKMFMLCLLQNWEYACGKSDVDCSRCQGYSHIHCWCNWIDFSLLFDRIVTISYQTEISLQSSYKVLFFDMQCPKGQYWVCSYNISYSGVSIIKKTKQIKQNTIYNVYTKNA